MQGRTWLAPGPVRRLLVAYFDGRLKPDTNCWNRWRFVDDVLLWTEARNVWFGPNDLRCWWFERDELRKRRQQMDEQPAQYLLGF